METLPPELDLLLSCARTRPSAATDLFTRQTLDGSFDWKLFAALAMRHGLASLAGESLLRAATDRVPDDTLDALRAITDQLRRRNIRLLEELGRVVELLQNEGIDAIIFSGPVLAMRAYGDVGLRPFGHLDFLVRDPDIGATISILRTQGYESGNRLTQVQSQLIRRLEGREQLSRKVVDANFWVHTRLTPLSWAVDIDYPALWRRAARTTFNGHEFLTLRPEDEVINSALNRGRPGWRNLKPLCDVAALLQANPVLDWATMMERARKQGCRRRVMAAVRLASKYFDASIPEWVAAAAESDVVLKNLDGPITASWSADEAGGPKRDRNSAIGTWWLQDGAIRRIRYLTSNALLPKPHHVAAVSLPKKLAFAYAAVKLAYDAADGLVRKPCRGLRSRLGALRNRVAAS
jgi:hypothetical protein